ncbi:MAG: ATP-dependent helicase [Acidimicrobiales bacterium]
MAVTDLLAGLDAEQRHAVTTRSQPLVIRAGAGSGKTRVLTRRLAYRAAEGDLDPRRALCVTFTREAASELRGRVRQLGLRDLPAAGTFHSIALGLLRGRWHDLRQAEPSLVQDRAAVLRRIAGRRVDGPTLVRVGIEIDWARARSIRPDRYRSALSRRRRTASVDPALVEQLFGDYETAKRRGRLVDFDDLLERCAEAFRTDPTFAEAQRHRFRHLFVDEFQDVNPLQFKLLLAWLGPNRDLCAVGDANQAIYGWNGADPTLFDRLVELLDGGEIVELRTNHRSSPAVVAVSGAALPPGAAPSPAVGRPEGVPPRVVACRDEADELSVIAAQLQRWHDRGVAWREQAVLVRTNALARSVLDALGTAGVPAALAGGDHRALLRELPPLEADLAWDDLLELLAEPGRAALAALAAEYAALDLRPSPAGFARWAATATADEGLSLDAVRVGTFHRAKGREWRAVIVAGVEDGLVPASTVRADEERRLFYVALSRATEALLCTWAAQRTVRGAASRRLASPFLAAVQQACDEADAAAAPAPMPAALASFAGRSGPGGSGGRGSRGSRGEQPPAVATTTGRARHLALVTGDAAPPRPALDPEAARRAARHAALLQWRATRARLAAVAPAAVLDDATLAALADRPPTDEADLAGRPGVGPMRARRLAPALLATLAALP